MPENKFAVRVSYKRDPKRDLIETETMHFSDAAGAIEFAKRQNKIKNVVKAVYLGAKK